MRVVWRLAAVAGCGALVACAAITDLDSYSACEGCADATAGVDAGTIPSDDGATPEGRPPSDVTASDIEDAAADASPDAGMIPLYDGTPPEGQSGADAAEAKDATEQDAPRDAPWTGDAANDADAGDGATTSSCPRGGCNATGGTCSGAGQGCYCTSNSQCASGQCEQVTGQNDVSCGSRCTSTTARTDGFSCVLAANGIPAAPVATGFGYTPSNFNPASYTPPAGATTDCNATYSSSSGTFTGSCTGAAPSVHHNVTQSGGPNVDLLVFASLTIAGGSTLTLTGANPVILAVYGNATINGHINAGATAAGTPGAGGNNATYCGTGGAGSGSPYTDQLGGGGGGRAVVGGNGGGLNGANGTDTGGVGGTAPVPNSSTGVPLVGGCGGGAGGSASGTCSATGAAASGGGAGGGAVQISAAGTVTVASGGGISTNGFAGSSVANSVQQSGGWGCGGGGGGAAGDIVLEGTTVTTVGASITASGGGGGSGSECNACSTTSPGGGGGAGDTGANPGNGVQPGSNCSGVLCGPIYVGSGGGGGARGFVVTNTGKATATYACPTTLSPAPVPSAADTACLCVADSDCSSGKCSNADGQCTAANNGIGPSLCSGTTTAGTYDGADCQGLTSL